METFLPKELLDFVQPTIQRHPPDVSACEPMQAYHGTSAQNAKAILKEGQFALGYDGRLGPAVYFHTGDPEIAIAASLHLAEGKFMNQEDFRGSSVVEATINLRHAINLDAPNNDEFVRRVKRRVSEFIRKDAFAQKYGPGRRDQILGLLINAHFAGYLARHFLGTTPGLDCLDGIITHFGPRTSSPTGSVQDGQAGVAVFDLNCIANIRVVR